jgi:hypothetical protein
MKLGNELLDLPLCLVNGPREHRVPALGREERNENRDAAHVEPPVGEQVEQDRMSLRR